jgi:hypothetical protein
MDQMPPTSSDNPLESWPRITAPPRLLASTEDTYRCSVSATAAREELQVPEVDATDRRNRKFLNGSESNVFKSVQWFVIHHDLPESNNTHSSFQIGRPMAQLS